MGFFADNSKDAYETALLAAETNPRGLTGDQKEKLKKLSKEHSARGNRARKILGQR